MVASVCVINRYFAIFTIFGGIPGGSRVSMCLLITRVQSLSLSKIYATFIFFLFWSFQFTSCPIDESDHWKMISYQIGYAVHDTVAGDPHQIKILH